MEKRPGIVLIVILSMFVIGLVFASFLGDEPGTAASSGKRFRAKPGTMRQGARALVSKTAPRNEKKVKRTGKGKTMDGWAAPENLVKQKKAAAESGHAVTTSALSAPSSETGIQMISEALTETTSPSEQSQLYSSLSLLYAQEDEKNLEGIRQALNKAFQLAQTEEDRHEAYLAEVQILLNMGHDSAAQKRLEKTFEEAGQPTEPGLHMGVMLAKIYEEAGEREKAEARYRHVMDQWMQSGKRFSDQAANIYRQACLRLARLYRKSGKETEAKAVAQEMKLNLEHLAAASSS